MTKRNLSKPFGFIKSFLYRSKKRQAYLESLEAAYLLQSSEIRRLKRHC